MYKVNTEKVTSRYTALVQKHSAINAECNNEATQVAVTRGYNSDLTDKLSKFLYAEKYKNEDVDKEIEYLSGYIEEVENVEGIESGEVTNQYEAQ